MSTKTDFSAVPSSYERKKPPIPSGTENVGRPAAPCPNLTTVDVVADGSLAVTRPGLPRLLRFFLLLTGVKV
jgi:hypothetical protein